MIAIGQPSFKRVHIYQQTGNTWTRILSLNGDRPSGQYLIDMGKFMTVTKQGYIGTIDNVLVQPPLLPIIKRKAVFTANMTNNATVNTVIKTVQLQQGQTLRFGTEGLDNAYTEDDTYIRLYDPNGLEVASNDDYDNRGSFISYVALETGTYSMHIGCYADDYCTGIVAWEVLPTE